MKKNGLVILVLMIVGSSGWSEEPVTVEEYPYLGTLHEATAALVIDATEWQMLRQSWVTSFNVDSSGFFDDLFLAMAGVMVPAGTGTVQLSQGEYDRIVSLDSANRSLTLSSYYTITKKAINQRMNSRESTGDELAWIISDASSYVNNLAKRSAIIETSKWLYDEQVNGSESLLP